MADIKEWENTGSANNKGATPDFPVQNQDKSTVNDCARENMAALRRAFENVPWVNLVQAADTVSYVSNDSFQIAGADYTVLFNVPGLRVRVGLNSAAWVEREISSAAFGTDTTVTLKNTDPSPTTAIANPSNTVEIFIGSSHQAAHHEVGTTTGKIPRIEDLGDGALLDQGTGNTFDADTVDGKHFSDITDEIAAVATASNLLINSDFGIWQEFGPTKFRGVSDEQFCDGWAPVGDTVADAVDTERTTTSTEIPSGQDSGLRVEQTVADQQAIGVYQIVEARVVKPLRSKTVSLSFQCDALTGTANDVETIRWQLLEWTGTEDTFTADPINSWSTAPRSPDGYATGWALLKAGSQDLTGGGFVSCTDEMITLTSGANNLLLVIWASESDDRFYGIGDGFNLGAVQLGAGDTAVPYTMEDEQTRLRRCQRFYWKSFELDTAVANNAAASGTMMTVIDGLRDFIFSTQHPVLMHSAPTMSNWSVLSASANQIRYPGTGGTTSLSWSTVITDRNFRAHDTDAGGSANLYGEIHLSFDARFWG
jgi:hypothetical protein